MLRLAFATERTGELVRREPVVIVGRVVERTVLKVRAVDDRLVVGTTRVAEILEAEEVTADRVGRVATDLVVI